MTMNARSLWFCCSLPSLLAQGWQLTPVEPPPRPLLLFATRDDAAKPPDHRWHLVDLAGGPAREFLRCHDNLSIICRLDLRRLLIEWHGENDGLFVVDLGKGTTRRVGDRAWQFVAMRGGELLYVGDERRNDNRLYAQAWAVEGPARALAEARVGGVWLRDDAAVAVTTGDAPEVWWIDLLRGGGRKLLDIPGGQEAGWSLEAAVAPGARHFALGFPNGTLRVHAAADGALVREWTGIPLQLSPFSSSSPRLKCDFVDADTVIATESRGHRGGIQVDFATVRRSIASGEVIDTRDHIGNLQHEPPLPRLPPASILWGWPGRPGQEREAHGQFEITGDELFFVGAKEPIARRVKQPTGESIEFAPDGSFAVVLRDQEQNIFDLVDPIARTRRRLHTGWTLNHTWLPAPP